MAKLRDGLEGFNRRNDRFSGMIDERRRSIAQELGALTKVNYSAGFKAHQSRAGCVCGYLIIRKHDLSQDTRVPFRGPLPSIAMMPSAITK